MFNPVYSLILILLTRPGHSGFGEPVLIVVDEVPIPSQDAQSRGLVLKVPGDRHHPVSPEIADIAVVPSLIASGEVNGKQIQVALRAPEAKDRSLARNYLNPDWVTEFKFSQKTMLDNYANPSPTSIRPMAPPAGASPVFQPGSIEGKGFTQRTMRLIDEGEVPGAQNETQVSLFF